MPKIVVVGDRLFTDVLMANRFGPSKALAVWTTGLWVKEALVLRRLEKTFLNVVLKYRRTRPMDYAHFIKNDPQPPSSVASRRAVYAAYPLAALRWTWNGARGIVAKATESPHARALRKTEEARINSILRAEVHPPTQSGFSLTTMLNSRRKRLPSPPLP